MAVVRMPAWSTVLVGSVATALMQTESSSQLLSILKKAFVLLLVLNWRALPFAWHIGESSLKRRENESWLVYLGLLSLLPSQSSGDWSRSCTTRFGQRDRSVRWRLEGILTKSRRLPREEFDGV